MAGYDYNALYQSKPDALGAAYDRLHEALKTHLHTRSTVLDIGCGQGCDALPLARSGHSVTAVDAAPEGLRALNESAAREGLDITGLVADLTVWRPDAMFDALLCNRTLHMLDTPDRHALFNELLDNVSPGGLVFIVDEPSNMPDLIRILSDTHRTQTILRHSGGDYFVQLDT